MENIALMSYRKLPLSHMMMLDHIYSLFRLARIYSSLILTFNEEKPY